MGLLSGIGSALRLVANTFDPGKPRDMSDPQYWADFGGRMAVAGVEVNEHRVSQLGAVQAVRGGISGAMSSLPVSVFRRGAKGARTPLPDHPLSKLLGARPNDRNSPAELIGELAWHVAYARNAFAVIRPGDDPAAPNYAIGELELLHPRRLSQVERRVDGHVYYTFRPPATIVQSAQLASEIYRDDQLWHLRGNPLREDGLLGEPIWESAREVFGRAIAVHDYGNIWFANSGQTGGVIEHPGTFENNDAKDDFLRAWRDSSVGRNRHRDRLLLRGAKYTALKVTNAEAQLLETEKACDTDIFGLWSYPPHRAARLERSTNNNIEQQSLDFVVFCLAPVAIAIEQAAERDLLLDNASGDLFVEFNFWGLLRADIKARYAAYMMGRQGEWLSANDVLRLENMSPRTDAGGDEYKNPVTKNSGADTGGAGDNQDSGSQKDSENG
jgi:HK97 family phage portal protein